MTAPAMPYVTRQGYANTELLTYGTDFTPNTVEVYDAIKSITTSEDLYGHESPSLERANTLMEAAERAVMAWKNDRKQNTKVRAVQ